MNKAEFIQQLQESERPTIVDFWAPWCRPCRRTKPILEELAQSYIDQVDFQTINADEHPELMRELQILGIPTLLIMDSHKNMQRITGAQTSQNYQHMFETLANGDSLNTAPISNLDRLMRLGIGAVLTFIAWTNATWWLLPLGLLIMFWGIYDRCPIWQALSARFKRKKAA